jgi:hypothetical protein
VIAQIPPRTLEVIIDLSTVFLSFELLGWEGHDLASTQAFLLFPTSQIGNHAIDVIRKRGGIFVSDLADLCN